jgi:hypothetical protein
MKRIYQNATKTITDKMAGILLLSLLATPPLVHAQHNRFQINSPAPSRPAPAIERPEPRESRPEPRESRPEPRESRPEPRESRPAQAESRHVADEPRPTPKAHSPEPPTTRPAVNTNKSVQRQTEPASSGSLRAMSSTSNNDARAKVTSVQDPARRVTVSAGPHNVRMAESRRADGTRLVTAGRSRGFVEHPIANRPGYVARTYVANGRSYVQVYRAYSFHGFAYYRFVPAVYYRPLFYQWVFNPWPAPIYFAWGWNVAPWYGYYGFYFTPAPIYPTPALWLTDYVLAENLRQAYENQQQNGELPPPPPEGQAVALSPEVKQAIAEEVRQQLVAEQAAAAAGDATKDSSPLGSAEAVPPALNPTQRIFVVSTNLNVQVGGQVCALTPGDIILHTADTIGVDGKVGVSVLSSKPGDCAINASSAIDVVTLQEMHNQFRAQIDSGLSILAANQGKGGLPKGPDAKPHSATKDWAKADGKAESELRQQQQDVDQAETQQLADGGLQNR